MSIHTNADQTINVVRHHGGLRIVIECADDICEPVEFDMSADEWFALVNQGYRAILGGGE